MSRHPCGSRRPRASRAAVGVCALPTAARDALQTLASLPRRVALWPVATCSSGTGRQLARLPSRIQVYAHRAALCGGTMCETKLNPPGGWGVGGALGRRASRDRVQD